MPRSDGWTIHMPSTLIKRAGRAGVASASRREGLQPTFASPCRASVNRLKISIDRAHARTFATGKVTRFFSGDDDRCRCVAF
jgi:hypothetical protein